MSPAESKLLLLSQQAPGGRLRISKRQVPYLLYSREKVSVSYFGRSRQFAVFTGFSTPKNRRQGLYGSIDDTVQALSVLLGTECVN